MSTIVDTLKDIAEIIGVIIISILLGAIAVIVPVLYCILILVLAVIVFIFALWLWTLPFFMLGWLFAKMSHIFFPTTFINLTYWEYCGTGIGATLLAVFIGFVCYKTVELLSFTNK